LSTPARTAGEPAGSSTRVQPLKMRTALVHDWFQGFHGSERTVAAMFDVLERDPDVFTFHAAHELLPDRLAGAIVKESRLGRLPGVRQRGHEPGRWRWLLPYMPHWFDHLDLDGYELVLSSSHACAAGVRTAPDTVHACYCHTPMRYVWMPEAERNRVSGVKGAALRALRGRLRKLDRRASARPDLYIANSTEVADRIKRFYGREAVIVPPPVAVDDFPRDVPRDPSSFLWVHRLVAYKRPLEVAEAFRELPDLRLTMVGLGPLEDELRARLPPNVELLGWVSRERLAELFAGAAGFIHVGEEDFGISMVEALAAGTPVLAADAGGARDIVRPEHDGVLIADPTEPRQIRNGVRELADRSWDADNLRRSAQRFSEERFHERLAEALRGQGAR
jgi:glycosyltransferase involved in cell wall biosynthesis